MNDLIEIWSDGYVKVFGSKKIKGLYCYSKGFQPREYFTCETACWMKVFDQMFNEILLQQKVEKRRSIERAIAEFKRSFN